MKNLKIKVPTIEELLVNLINLEEKLEYIKSIKDEELTEEQCYNLMCLPAQIKSLEWKIKNYSKYSRDVLNTTTLREEGYEKELKIYQKLNSLLKEN